MSLLSRVRVDIALVLGLVNGQDVDYVGATPWWSTCGTGPGRGSPSGASAGTSRRRVMNALLLDTPSAVPAQPATPAEGAVAAAAAMVDPIGLDELMALAELQTRVDRKYFVPGEVFRRWIGELAEELQVLEIDGRRSFGYESVYFDTPYLDTYRAHLRRHRQRFKARTRTYTDSGLTMLERRVRAWYRSSAELTDEALAHLGAALCQAYRQDRRPGCGRPW